VVVWKCGGNYFFKKLNLFFVKIYYFIYFELFSYTNLKNNFLKIQNFNQKHFNIKNTLKTIKTKL